MQPDLFDYRPPAAASILGDRDGHDYEPKRDRARLNAQATRIWDFMQDGRWHTLRAIAEATGDPENSVSAQLRHFRKPKFGGHAVGRRYVKNGLYEYKLTPNV